MPHLIVQFPHLGKEHLTDNNGSAYYHSRQGFIKMGYIPWNDGAHRRKFFNITGSYIDKSNLLHEYEKICFWGEWEPPSSFTPLASAFNNPVFAHNKLFAHDPVSYNNNLKIIVQGLPNNFAYPCNPVLQNTDPYVFGEHFLYSNCKQTGEMKNLCRGSIILFGSCINQSFVLDTVFVVADAIEYCLEESEDFFKNLINVGWISETYYNVTIKALQNDPTIKNKKNKLKLYQGATINSPVDGMFSFFPCSTCSTDGGFIRPELNRIDISPKLNTNRKYLKVSHKEAWSEVVKQVGEKKLLFGVYVKEPLLSIP